MLQLTEVVGRHYDGNYGWNLRQRTLKKRKLNLQAVLMLMCFLCIVELVVIIVELLGYVAVNSHQSQWGGVVVVSTVGRCSVEPCLMAWTKQKHSFVALFGIQRHISRCCHIA